MKKYFLILNLITSAAFAMDDINPIGKDQWKTLVVTIKQLDQYKLNNAKESYIYYRFGDGGWKSVSTASVKAQADIVKKITIPRRDNGNYTIQYCYHSNQNCHDLETGTIDNGMKDVDVRLKRIDVNHMTVTNEDGSTYLASEGDVTVSALFANSEQTTTRFKTGFGIDVPVGREYKIHVATQTKDGVDNFKALLDFTKL